MLQYILSHIFKLFVRLGVLLVSCLTMSRIINEELGYRMDFGTMLAAATMMIVVVRIWMPWHKDT